jgi:hypothetical protein
MHQERFKERKMKRVSLALLALCATSFAQENLALWSKYKVITLNTKVSGANVTANVTKVPVLVRLDSVNAADVFTGANPGGTDIRFSNAAGAAVPFEIEQWNATAKKAAIWVLADTVKASDSVAALRLYWGRSSAVSASNGPAVFDTANGYVGAWHLGNGAGTGFGPDSTRPSSVRGAPKAVLRNALPAVSGLIGLADTLGLTSVSGNSTNPLAGRYLDISRDSAFGAVTYAGYRNFTSGFTYSAWMNPSAHVGFARWLTFTNDSAAAANVSGTLGNRIILLARRNTDGNVAIRWLDNTEGDAGQLPVGYALNTWNHVVMVKAAGASAPFAYMNGVFLGAATSTGSDAPVVDRNVLWIGRSGSTDGYFQGKVDELTLSKVARDTNFIKLSYQTQKPASTVVTLGATTTVNGTPVAISALAYTTKAADTLTFLTGKAASITPTYAGGPVDSFKVVSGSLPAGLALTKATGVLSGTPTAAVAASDLVIRAWGHASAGDSVSRTVRVAVFAPASLNYSPDSIDVNINTAFPTTNATYAGAPAAFTVSPALPAGLTLNASTGAITGTPTAATARASYTVKAKNAVDSATKVLRIRVVDPTSINGREGSLASGFSARSSAQGILFRMAGTQSGEKAVLNLVDMWGRTVFTGAFQGGALNWNGKSTKGHEVSSGIYVARVKIVDAQGRMRKVNEHKVPFTR